MFLLWAELAHPFPSERKCSGAPTRFEATGSIKYKHKISWLAESRTKYITRPAALVRRTWQQANFGQ